MISKRQQGLLVGAAVSLLVLAMACVWAIRGGIFSGRREFLTPESVGMALCLYKLDVGNYPIHLDALVKGVGIKGWNGPYLSSGRLLPDAWGTPLQYQRDGQGYSLRSAGRDRAFGSLDDDVVSRSE